MTFVPLIYSAVGAFLKLYVRFSKYTAFCKQENKNIPSGTGSIKLCLCLMFFNPP